MKADVWKLKGIRRGMDKESCPQCVGSKDANYRCAETKRWSTELLCKTWLNMVDKLACRMIVVSSTVRTLKKCWKIFRQRQA
jgi:hypothetical protein